MRWSSAAWTHRLGVAAAVSGVVLLGQVLLGSAGPLGLGPAAPGDVGAAGTVRAAALIGGPLAGLSPDELGRFEAGAAIFAKAHGPDDGLGPHFNARACVECHAFPSAGGTDKTRDHLTTHVGREDGDRYDNLLESGGPFITRHTVASLLPGCSLSAEKKPRAATAVSERQPPAVYGMGLVAAIPDDTLLALAAAQQTGGEVAGRPQWIDGRLGRFGMKAQFSTLEAAVADALRNELGITNPVLPDEKLTAQPADPACDLRPDQEDGGSAVALLTDYLTLLAPPPRGPVGAAEQRGAMIFQEVGCASCHVPSLKTGESPIPALAYQDVPLYSDLLLHDMGEYLADGIRVGEAGGTAWRTAPLWGVGRRLWYLHDGRATDLRTVLELHNGEAKATRDQLFKRRRDDLQDVLTFLRSL